MEGTSGVLFVDKPVGMTSRKVDNTLGRLFHTRHIGHLGTLDPFASGMLIVFVNKANKCSPFVLDEEKTYVALLRLGKKTTTGDKDGEVIEEGGRTAFSKEEVVSALNSFLGKGKQIPPMTSAIKIDGEALYKKAHRGETIERKPRDIEVFSISLLSYNNDEIIFRAKVSKGTYIRTLGEDIAAKLGTVGYLEELRRISIGDFGESKMVPLGKIDEKTPLENPLDLIALPRHELNENEVIEVKNGVRQTLQGIKSDKILLTYQNQAIAVYERKEGSLYQCLRGLF
ncbi:MAG: tRNA pseudouridine(55) synthase TruB [Bacilli bacterium]|nr:tRNA pseudouridine(55) synthase TruB [Bacilli bacterium]